MTDVLNAFTPTLCSVKTNDRGMKMKTDSSRRKSRRVGAAVVTGAMLMQSVAPAFAAVSQVPGLYTTPPDPNVMFTLDSSGSMASDAIPDFGNNVAGMPTNAASNAYNETNSKLPGMWKSGTNYWAVQYYQSTNNVARYMRSSAGNPLYYNPTVTYKPWPTAANDKVFQANANPAAVNIHPSDPTNTSFTRDITQRVAAGAAADDEAVNFWPATYYVYKGVGPTFDGTPALPQSDPAASTSNAATNFTKYEIKPTVLSYPRGTDRTDCVGATCTYAEELQNFANWLQYYRSRNLMAKGGVAAAFAKQGTNLRVGFGTLSNPASKGVETFTGTARSNFYTSLYGVNANGGTPLRVAMDKVGQYFQKTGAGNPWAQDPTAATAGTEYTCRRSFHILSTDGFWNGNSADVPAKNDNDTFSGQTPKKGAGGTTDKDYTYSDSASSTLDPLVARFGISPFSDGTGDLLADVAAYYWKTDLRPMLNNDVSSTKRDPAFWQHVSTYTVGLGITGTGTVKRTSDNSTTVPATEPTTSPFYPYRGKAWLSSQALRDLLISNRVALTWPAVAADKPETGDDLIHASMNGRGQYFSATSPTQLAIGLAAALAEATDNPGSLSNVVTSSPQVATTTAVYQGTYNPNGWFGRLYAFPQSGTGSVDTTPGKELWEASNKMPDPASRNIYTWNPVTLAGSTFTWAGLSLSQQVALNNDSTLLDFLRGSDAKEAANGGSFRDRSRYKVGSVTGGVLGDIVNSSPIKGPSAGGDFQRLPSGVPGQSSYATYRSTGNTALDNMRNTLFVGANDGMLHAFDRDTGVERFAFVPNSVFSVPRSLTGTELKLKMLSDPAYTHRFTVDGPPQIADAFIGTSAAAAAWKTVLVGSTGAGARSVFAMDISNPKVETSGFSQSKLLWEFSETNNTDMGYVIGYPHIARMRANADGTGGAWVAIFGNGYDSVNGQAKLFIVNLQTGAVVWQQSVGAAGGNGLSQPNFTLNENREVTAIYAGDLKGNLWKFDVNNADPTQWKVAFGGAPNYTPLWQGSTTQPITVMPELTYHPNDGWLVSFGTGKLFEDTDLSTVLANNVNLNAQAIYGIWDKPGELAGFSGSSTLVQQSANSALGVAADTTLSGTTANTIDWATKRGWYINLVGSGERVNVNPEQQLGTLLVVANKPDSDPCKSGGSSRLFALEPITGAVPDRGVLDANGSGSITNADKGYNVKAFSFAVMSLASLQSKKSGTDAVALKKADSRGQTGELLGGVEKILTYSKSDCTKWLLAGGSDTSIAGFDISLCKSGTPRISWRQLK